MAGPDSFFTGSTITASTGSPGTSVASVGVALD